MSQAISTDVLVIGFGNECRSDDGIGPEVARRIEAMSLPNVRVLIVHQLLPELAELISTVDRVIFVDAYKEAREPPIVMELVCAEEANSLVSHRVDARALIGLANVLYGRAAQAWMVTIQGECFGPGEGLSIVGKRRAQEACQDVLRLIHLGFAALEVSHPSLELKDQG